MIGLLDDFKRFLLPPMIQWLDKYQRVAILFVFLLFYLFIYYFYIKQKICEPQITTQGWTKLNPSQ